MNNMLIEQVIYNVKTGETRIEQIEVEDVIEDLEPIQSPTIEERLLKLENANIDIQRVMIDALNNALNE